MTWLLIRKNSSQKAQLSAKKFGFTFRYFENFKKIKKPKGNPKMWKPKDKRSQRLGHPQIWELRYQASKTVGKKKTQK